MTDVPKTPEQFENWLLDHDSDILEFSKWWDQYSKEHWVEHFKLRISTFYLKFKIFYYKTLVYLKIHLGEIIENRNKIKAIADITFLISMVLSAIFWSSYGIYILFFGFVIAVLINVYSIFVVKKVHI